MRRPRDDEPSVDRSESSVLRAAVVLAVAVFAAAVPGGRASAREVRVEWVDPAGALPCPFESITSEVARLFAPLGIDVRWLAAGRPPGGMAPEHEVVVLAKDRSHSLGEVMGVTRMEEGRGMIWIVLPAVERTLYLPPAPAGAMADDDARLLARAVGRVVAHELVHALAPGLPHARKGLMSGRLGRSALLADSLALDPGSARAVLGTRDTDGWAATGAGGPPDIVAPRHPVRDRRRPAGGL